MISDMHSLTGHVHFAQAMTNPEQKSNPNNKIISLLGKGIIIGGLGAIVGGLAIAFTASSLPIILGAVLGAGALLGIAGVAYHIYKLAMKSIGSPEQKAQVEKLEAESKSSGAKSGDEILREALGATLKEMAGEGYEVPTEEELIAKFDRERA